MAWCERALRPPLASAAAHGVAGNRFFPATLATDDPAVAEELSLPTVSWSKPDHDTDELDISTEWSKRITPHFGVSFGETWTSLRPDGGPNADGFQNLEASVKYQFLTDAAHETILSVGFESEIGGSGAKRVGADNTTTVAPAFYFGKGFGDLPDSAAALRPFAITGQIGYAFPTRAHETQSLEYGGALEYSFSYLHAHVRDYGLPSFVNHLTLVTEFALESPAVNGAGERTAGTINPGLIWTGHLWQFGAEAVFPVNKDSGATVGALMQLHFYLDDIFPHSIGHPIFGGA